MSDKPEPVAWRWKNKLSKLWVYNPEPDWIASMSDEIIDKEQLYGPDLLEAYEKSEAECAALREELRKQASEAYTDVEAWGAYASAYFAQKWDLEGDLKKWRERAAIKEQP